MAAQCVSLVLLLLACLVAVASPAAINIASPLEDVDLNVMPAREAAGPINLNYDDISLLVDDNDNEEDRVVEKPYVDASEFRHPATVPADSVKAKASSPAKKALPDARKPAKQGHEVKSAISTKLEPPVEGESPDLEDAKLAHVVSAIRKVIEAAGESIIKSLNAEAIPTTVSTEAPTREDADELPRLSPPIWAHSSRAEALADPLHLPLVETYDRYDRYSHSIARDLAW